MKRFIVAMLSSDEPSFSLRFTKYCLSFDELQINEILDVFTSKVIQIYLMREHSNAKSRSLLPTSGVKGFSNL